jgi:hypothetical protein
MAFSLRPVVFLSSLALGLVGAASCSDGDTTPANNGTGGSGGNAGDASAPKPGPGERCDPIEEAERVVLRFDGAGCDAHRRADRRPRHL